jgi:low molecular weight protein-tyrosine phosphatase
VTATSERISGERSSGTRQIAKRAYHAIRNLPDRLLHRRRHNAVRMRLSSAHAPRKILVVCYGNVCRSPYLQAVLQRALPKTEVISAGFVGADRAVPDASLAISAKRGLDLSRFRSRPLVPPVVTGADLIIVMDARQAQEIATRFPVNRARILIAGDLDPKFDQTRAIRDPWNQPSEVFEESFDRLDRCAAVLVSVLERPSTEDGGQLVPEYGDL